MNATLRHLLKFTATGRWLVLPYRFFGIALPRILRQLRLAIRWAFKSKEHYNFTYDLTDLNERYLGSFIAVISGHSLQDVEKYIAEIKGDEQLRSVLMRRARASRDRHNSDIVPLYGRRLGWYALVRATKPRIVLETGVDRGLGTAVLAAALLRNAAEGFPGIVYATDVVPDCGYLLDQPFKACCQILLGDSVKSLQSFREPVDIFLHDSDHRPEYEWAEFMAIEPRLHAGSLVLSDNSAETSKLLEFAARRGKSFLYFQDQPKDHWWPGDGIGAAFVPGVKTFFPALQAAEP